MWLLLYKNRFKLTGLITLSVLFFYSTTLFTKPQALKRSNYIVPPKEIIYFSNGFKNQISDLFWLRAIQDFDYCDQKENETECRGKSWLYHVLDLTVTLDKNFLEAYFYGGLALTIIISDYQGASDIFKKGVEVFPNNWELNYVAGYHSMIEEKDFVEAAKRYKRAAENGAPTWVFILAGRMATEGENKDFAIKVLDQMIQLKLPTTYINRLKKKIEESN